MRHTILISLSALLLTFALSCQKEKGSEIMHGNLSGKWALLENEGEELAGGHYLDFYVGRCYRYMFTGQHPVARDTMWDCRNMNRALIEEMDFYITDDNAIVFGSEAPQSIIRIGENEMQIGERRYARVKHFVDNQRSDFMVESVGMAAPSIDMLSGGEADLYFQVSPSKAIYHKVEWSSSNPKVITVDQNGHIKALSVGQARITVTIDEQISGECTVSSGNDLAAQGTSNCYIASSPGRWFFRADVKGNSQDPVVPDSYTGTLKAVVLWESDGTMDVPQTGSIVKNVECINRHIFFTCGGKDGNALIALANENDEIYWSWHIWVCRGYDPELTQQQYKNQAGKTEADKKKTIMMDRNLGALSAMPENLTSTGLLYQWGRKDPFPGIAALKKDDNTPAATTRAIKMVDCDETVGTIAYATAHPTHFIKPVSNYLYGAFNWFYSTQSDQQTERINRLWMSEKTIYDPCPPGWRVPSGNVGTDEGQRGVWRSAFTYSTESGRFWTGLVSFDLTSILPSTPGETCYYPVAGKLLGKTGTYESVGGMGFYWSCTLCKDKGTSYYYPNALYLVYNQGCACYSSPPSWVVSMDDAIFSRANGHSVRCQKIITE